MAKLVGSPVSLLGHMAQNAGANLLMPLSSIITGPLLARALGPSDRGAMAALLVPISLANLLFTFGLPESLTFHVARRHIDRRGVITISLVGGALAGILSTGILWAITPMLLRNYPDQQTAFRVLSLTLPLTLTFAAVRGVVQGRRRFELVAYERFTGVALRLTLLVLLVIAGLLTPLSAATVTVLAAIVGSLFLVRCFFGRSAPVDKPAGFAAMSRFGALAAIATVGGVLMLRLDQAIMAPLTSPEQLGFYAVAVSVAELPLALALAARDVVTTVAADTQDPRYSAMVSRRTSLIIVPLSLIGIGLAPFVIPLLFGDPFGQAVPMTQILLLGTVASASATILSGGLLSAGRPALRSVVMAAGAVVTIPVLFLLVPLWGGVGAAAASAGSYLAVGLLTAVVFARVTDVSLRQCLLPDREDIEAVINAARRVTASRRGAARR
jgi:O-antigen/teichoic acid export membrane protein